MALQNWAKLAIHDYALFGASITELAEKYGRTRTRLSQHINSAQGKALIAELRADHFDSIKRAATEIATAAKDTLLQAFKHGDPEKVAGVALHTLLNMGLLAPEEPETTESSEDLEAIRRKVLTIVDRESA